MLYPAELRGHSMSFNIQYLFILFQTFELVRVGMTSLEGRVTGKELGVSKERTNRDNLRYLSAPLLQPNRAPDQPSSLKLPSPAAHTGVPFHSPQILDPPQHILLVKP